jgi:hypothetical protein
LRTLDRLPSPENRSPTGETLDGETQARSNPCRTNDITEFRTIASHNPGETTTGLLVVMHSDGIIFAGRSVAQIETFFGSV